jgi:hypothetical protein
MLIDLMRGPRSWAAGQPGAGCCADSWSAPWQAEPSRSRVGDRFRPHPSAAGKGKPVRGTRTAVPD